MISSLCTCATNVGQAQVDIVTLLADLLDQTFKKSPKRHRRQPAFQRKYSGPLHLHLFKNALVYLRKTRILENDFGQHHQGNIYKEDSAEN